MAKKKVPMQPKAEQHPSGITIFTYDLTQAETLKLLGLDKMASELEELGCKVKVSVEAAHIEVTKSK